MYKGENGYKRNKIALLNMTVYLLKEIGEDNVPDRLICIKNPYIMWKTIKQKRRRWGRKSPQTS